MADVFSAKQKFEKLFSEYFSAEAAFAFWKGRVALYAILKVLGVGEGDEVILPGYTCVMDVNPIAYVGAKSVFVDIKPDTYNFNTQLLENKITLNTKAIIAQHTYGYPCDMDAVMQIARKHNIPVIEDCCLSFGSKYKGKTVGTFGKAAYFSFQWNKPFTTGLGGMVITNDSELAKDIEQLCRKELVKPGFCETAMLAAQLAVYRAFIYPRTTALAQTVFRYLTKKGAVVGSSSTCEFQPEIPGNFFKAMSCVQAKSGIRQLRKIETNIAHRKKTAKLYDKLLSEKGWDIRDYDENVMEPVMVRYPVRIKEKDKALVKAARAGIELGSWFECPLHPIETPMQMYGYETGMCPESEKASKEVVNLPVHPRVSEKTVEKTVDFITQFTPAFKEIRS